MLAILLHINLSTVSLFQSFAAAFCPMTGGCKEGRTDAEEFWLLPDDTNLSSLNNSLEQIWVKILGNI